VIVCSSAGFFCCDAAVQLTLHPMEAGWCWWDGTERRTERRRPHSCRGWRAGGWDCALGVCIVGTVVLSVYVLCLSTVEVALILWRPTSRSWYCACNGELVCDIVRVSDYRSVAVHKLGRFVVAA
jgi:hypothetical protein